MMSVVRVTLLESWQPKSTKARAVVEIVKSVKRILKGLEILIEYVLAFESGRI